MAAEKPASGTSNEDVEEALAYLELLYGDAFTVGHDQHGYWAKPDDGGETMRADDPTELAKRMEGWLAR